MFFCVCLFSAVNAHIFADFAPNAKNKQEWHFHVYFFQNNNASYSDAMRLRSELIEQVSTGEFICVLNGVTSEILPGLDESNIPHVNLTPVGPHPIGSYEVSS